MSTWLFTNTTYGTWLPGDPRGSVTSVRERRADDPTTASRLEHSRYGTPVESAMPGLQRSALSRLKSEPVRLDQQHAMILILQCQETCRCRGWTLLAAAIMWNHYHLVIEIGNARAKKALSDIKAYASRALNRAFGTPPSGTWWTGGGSTRRLSRVAAASAGIDYVVNRQRDPLIVWTPGADASGSAPGADASGSEC